jgi:small subunit ribosomal protein S2
MLNIFKTDTFLGGSLKTQNSQIKPYILGKYSGQFILNVVLMSFLLKRIFRFIQVVIKNKGKILFISNGVSEINQIIKFFAIKHSQFYIIQPWVGGTFTNWDSVFKKIAKRKKEKKLINYFEGVSNMQKLPDLIFIFNVQENQALLHEAQILKIPTIGFIDASINYKKLSYGIPGNVKSIRSVLKYCSLISPLLK